MATTILAAATKSVAGADSRVGRAVDQLPQLRTNVSSTERWVCGALGGWLLTCGPAGKGPGLVSGLIGGFLAYRALSGHCPISQAVGFSTADATSEGSRIAAGHGQKVEHSVVIDKPVAEVYRFWRDLENLPRFMTHLIDVDTTVGGRSKWVAKGPLGMKATWEAEILMDRPNEVISWRSLDGSDVDTAGSVHFRPAGTGTEIRVSLKYDPPGGRLGQAFANLFGEAPEIQIREDLDRLKSILERGTQQRVTQQGGQQQAGQQQSVRR